MTTYHLDLSYPQPPIADQAVLVAMLPVSVYAVQFAPALDDGLPWRVFERRDGQRRDWPIGYPTFQAARDAAHDAAYGLVKQLAASKEG